MSYHLLNMCLLNIFAPINFHIHCTLTECCWFCLISTWNRKYLVVFYIGTTTAETMPYVSYSQHTFFHIFIHTNHILDIIHRRKKLKKSTAYDLINSIAFVYLWYLIRTQLLGFYLSLDLALESLLTNCNYLFIVIFELK